jgi:flagellar basal-body rod modification protein FlgD
MSTVSSVSNTSTADTTSKTGTAGSLDYQAFLKLFLAQLNNQDPTAPMDSSQFVAQLASFAQVEQAYATNTKLDSLLTASSLTIGDAAIGHTVTSGDGETSGVVKSVKITSDGPVATLENGDTIPLGSGVTIE